MNYLAPDPQEAKLLAKKLENKMRVFESQMTKPQFQNLKVFTRSLIKKGTTILSKLWDGEIATHKFREKLSRHLGNIDLIERVEEVAARVIKKDIEEESIISYDESDIFKPSAEYLPWLKIVRDGSARTKLLGNGYVMRGVNVNGILLSCCIDDSLEEKEHKNDHWKNESRHTFRVKETIERTRNLLWNKGIRVIDRGSDSIEIYDYLLELKAFFVIRAKGNRNITDLQTGEKKKVKEFVPGKYEVELEWWTRMYLHVIQKWKSKQPMRLFTNIEKKSSQVLEIYFKRWSIEKDFKKMKQYLWLEEIRVFMMQKIANIVAVIHFILVVAQELYQEIMEQKDFISQGLYLYFKRFAKRRSLTMNSSCFLTYLSHKLPMYFARERGYKQDPGLFNSSDFSKKMGLF